MTAKYLFVASELDLFAALGSDSLTLTSLSEKIDVPVRTLRIVADALTATGFLTCEDGQYQNTPLTETFLSGQTPMDLRPVLQLWDKVVYEQWRTLETAVRENKRTYGLPEYSPEQHRIFNAGIATLTVPSAKALAQKYDFSHHRRILDLAGGMGLFLTFAIQSNEKLTGTLMELPSALQMARQRLASTPFADRIDFLEGDILTAGIPSGYDLLILANITHILSPENNLALLNRIREAVEPSSRLLLIDFWTNPSHTEPVFAALMAGEFHIYSGEGDVYSVAEMNDWLDASGWKMVEHRHLAGAASLIIAEAV
jgi:hypothetical protein